MRRLFPILAALLLSACSTTLISPAHTYRAPGETDSTTIAGTMKRDKALVGWNYAVTVTANGNQVCQGAAPGRMTGFMGARKVECECMTTSGGPQCFAVGTSFSCVAEENVRCFVFVDRERAADLTFH